MPTPRILILRAPGTNCDRETAFAFEKAGGRSELVHINRLLENPELPDDYQVLCLPGGFSYGDDIAAGRILANQIRHHLQETLQAFKAAQKLILGICNGFQILIKSGVLLPDDPHGRTAGDLDLERLREIRRSLGPPGRRSTALRVSARHRSHVSAHRPRGRHVRGARCHAAATAPGTTSTGARYCGDDATAHDATLPFPINPNGSIANVAGVCDDTGRVLGLMPHPERYIDPTQHPRWTRGEARDPGDGLAIFANAIQYFSA